MVGDHGEAGIMGMGMVLGKGMSLGLGVAAMCARERDRMADNAPRPQGAQGGIRGAIGNDSAPPATGAEAKPLAVVGWACCGR
jgi:hypothetical protein